MTDEIELKLRLPEIVAGKKTHFTPANISTAFAVDHNTRQSSQHLVSTYFDTADEWLCQHGMALRIRRSGRQRIQTLKIPAGEVTGAQSLREFEMPVATDEPDLSLIDNPELQEQLAAAKIAERLQEIFVTDFHRTTWPITFEGSMIELALDRGKIIADGEEAPINELELELKSGQPVALFALAESVLEKIPFSLGHETKAARGYRLRSGKQYGAVKLHPIELPYDCNVGDAFTRIVGEYLSLLRANELAVISNEDPEGIHQFRVTLRRLRSLVRAYRNLMDETIYRQLATELRWLQSQFGPARDFDVFLAETVTPIRQRFMHVTALETLAKLAGARRVSARHLAHLALEDARYNRLQLNLYRWLATRSWQRQSATTGLDGSAHDFADRVLKKQHKKLCQLGEEGDVPEDQLHELRVAGKKMRYLGDAFRSFYKAKAVKKYHSRLAGLQDCLGALNDAFVGDQLMTDLIAKLAAEESPSDADIAHMRGLIAGWQASRIGEGLKNFKAQWLAFKNVDVFWKRDGHG